MYHFPLARCNVRSTWNFRTIASAWKAYSTQSSSVNALAQQTSDVVRIRPATPLSKRLLRTKGKHILWVDLKELKYGQDDVVHYSVDRNSMDWNRLDKALKELHKLDMMKHLKQFVEADARKYPSERIDSVHWNVEHSDEPTKEMWQILNGLSPPKHLELVGGWIEECNAEPLDALQHQWSNLDTLTLAGISDNDYMDSPPAVFSRISSLTLDLCCGLNFIPPHATRLKHVRILENNACDIFIYAVDHTPGFPQVLEVLEIESASGHDFCWGYSSPEFRVSLRQCTSLREFRFAAGPSDGVDTDLASYIPPSVEKLTLQFTRSIPFLHDFDDWIQHASDRAWLPQLKSFQLSIDPKSRVRDLDSNGKLLEFEEWPRKLENPPSPGELTPEAFDLKFEKKRDLLHGVLKSTRPSIDLLV